MVNELEAAISEQLESLEQLICNSATLLFNEYDRTKLLENTLLLVESRADAMVFDNDYLSNTNKLDCGLAMMQLRIAEISHDNNNIIDTLRFIANGNYLIGACQIYGLETSENSKKANKQRHIETNLIKQDAINYYVANHLAKISGLEKKAQSRAKNDAAVTLTKQQPIQFRTARKYIDEYHKKNTVS